TGALVVDGVAKFDGTNWVKVGGPFYPATVQAVQDGQHLYLAGIISSVMAPSPHVNNATYGIAEYDGTNWTVLGAGLNIFASDFPTVRSLVATEDGIVAGGHFSNEATLNYNAGDLILVAW